MEAEGERMEKNISCHLKGKKKTGVAILISINFVGSYCQIQFEAMFDNSEIL